MPVRVVLDTGLCMGVGECIFQAPELFEWSEGGSQAQLKADVADDRSWEEAARRAADCCPNFAITVTETD